MSDKERNSDGFLFLPRGDNFGTHSREKGFWKADGINPKGQKWYQETGLGMGQTLNVAAEKRGYTLADRGSWLSLRQKLGLPILKEGDAILLNLYHVIQVNPTKWPNVNADGAKAFSDFRLSDETQGIIKIFGIEKYGGAPFFPDAGKKEDVLGKQRGMDAPIEKLLVVEGRVRMKWILVADDEWLLLQIVTRVLRSNKREVIAVETGGEDAGPKGDRGARNVAVPTKPGLATAVRRPLCRAERNV